VAARGDRAAERRRHGREARQGEPLFPRRNHRERRFQGGRPLAVPVELLLSDNYIEEFGATKQVGTWCGILGTVNGGAASTIANNRIFNLSKKCNLEPDFRYVSLGANYGTGVVVVTGNVVHGIGTARGRGTGQYFTAQGERELKIVSTGNFIEGVQSHRFAGPHVTVSAGE
jgi:hypothetical protein